MIQELARTIHHVGDIVQVNLILGHHWKSLVNPVKASSVQTPGKFNKTITASYEYRDGMLAII